MCKAGAAQAVQQHNAIWINQPTRHCTCAVRSSASDHSKTWESCVLFHMTSSGLPMMHVCRICVGGRYWTIAIGCYWVHMHYML